MLGHIQFTGHGFLASPLECFRTLTTSYSQHPSGIVLNEMNTNVSDRNQYSRNRVGKRCGEENMGNELTLLVFEFRQKRNLLKIYTFHAIPRQYLFFLGDNFTSISFCVFSSII